MNKLLYSQNRKKARIYYCHYCLHGFIHEDLLQDHQPNCSSHGPQHIQLPDEDNASLYFKDYYKQLKVPFVIYTYFKSLTAKINSAHTPGTWYEGSKDQLRFSVPTKSMAKVLYQYKMRAHSKQLQERFL